MYFETKHKTVFSPENPILDSLYYFLEKYAPVLGDSPIFDKLISVYETLESELKEENE